MATQDPNVSGIRLFVTLFLFGAVVAGLLGHTLFLLIPIGAGFLIVYSLISYLGHRGDNRAYEEHQRGHG